MEKSEFLHKDEIRAGDVIRYRGIFHNVCLFDIQYEIFFGVSIFGDSYKLGYEKVGSS